MRSSDFPTELNGGSSQQVELPARRDGFLHSLQTKTDRVERDLRRLAALIIVYVSLQIFFYFLSAKPIGKVVDIIFIAIIGVNLLLSRDDVIKMKGQVRELKTLIKEGGQEI